MLQQQEMNTSLISEEEIEAVLQAWYETDGIRVYRDGFSCKVRKNIERSTDWK
ncbi:hypothetical protein [Bacillus mycoides]|uniref:hypothetical protein n=1 Tax=Bacillus mycoides TaxID=1405 RepID=UPI00039A9F86|nr:hypothetical protein [Bacillus mycoides]OSY03018.1 hypothetical protein S2E19_03215 [Bacillus mycoides]